MNLVYLYFSMYYYNRTVDLTILSWHSMFVRTATILLPKNMFLSALLMNCLASPLKDYTAVCLALATSSDVWPVAVVDSPFVVSPANLCISLAVTPFFTSFLSRTSTPRRPTTTIDLPASFHTASQLGLRLCCCALLAFFLCQQDQQRLALLLSKRAVIAKWASLF